MEFGFMKWVDYWVGRPVCWVLTLWRCMTMVFGSGKGEAAAPRKILIIKPSELGAIVLALPLIQRLQQRYPEAEVSFLTFEGNRPLFEVSGIIPAERVLTLTDASLGRFSGDVLRVLSQIRRERFDAVIDLEFFSRFTAILSYLSGARKRIGFHRYSIEGVYRGDLFTHKVPYNPHQHVQQMYLHMISSLDKKEKMTPESAAQDLDVDKEWHFQPTEEQLSHTWDKLASLKIDPAAKLYLLAPGEGRIPLREWPLENFVTLADQIHTDPEARIMVIGLADPAGRAAQFMKDIKCPERSFNLVGQTDLSELLTLFAISRALVVNDSGLAHLAALTAIKHCVLFGPEHPSIFRPCGQGTTIFYHGLPCSPCLSVFNHRNSVCRDNLCLKAITVDEIYTALVEK